MLLIFCEPPKQQQPPPPPPPSPRNNKNNNKNKIATNKLEFPKQSNKSQDIESNNKATTKQASSKNRPFLAPHQINGFPVNRQNKTVK